MTNIVTQVLASSVAIADKAGEIVRDIMKKGDLGIVEKTGKDDLQTQADRSAQNCIIASLAKQFPSLTVVGEEGEQDMSGVPEEWIVTTADTEAAKMRNHLEGFESNKSSGLVIIIVNLRLP